jgi:hypothetical protein
MLVIVAHSVQTEELSSWELPLLPCASFAIMCSLQSGLFTIEHLWHTPWQVAVQRDMVPSVFVAFAFQNNGRHCDAGAQARHGSLYQFHHPQPAGLTTSESRRVVSSSLFPSDGEGAN